MSFVGKGKKSGRDEEEASVATCLVAYSLILRMPSTYQKCILTVLGIFQLSHKATHMSMQPVIALLFAANANNS